MLGGLGIMRDGEVAPIAGVLRTGDGLYDESLSLSGSLSSPRFSGIGGGRRGPVGCPCSMLRI